MGLTPKTSSSAAVTMTELVLPCHSAAGIVAARIAKMKPSKMLSDSYGT